MRFDLKTGIKIGCVSVALMLTPAFIGNSAAYAQIDSDVQIRLNYLESEVKTLNKAVYSGENPAQSLQGNADMMAQMQDVQVQMRQLNGQIEEVAHTVATLQSNLDKVNQDNAMRFSDLEQKLALMQQELAAAKAQQQAAAQAESSVQAVLGESDKASAQGGETQTAMLDDQKPFMLSEGGGAAALAQYEKAFSLLKQGQYNSAQINFEEFLDKNPDHALASNAKYWLGETYYVRGDYNQAARIFAEGFQAYPRGAKAPDNLLKLGLTLEALGKKKDACVALLQIKKEFPAGASAVLARTQKEIERLQCQ